MKHLGTVGVHESFVRESNCWYSRFPPPATVARKKNLPAVNYRYCCFALT